MKRSRTTIAGCRLAPAVSAAQRKVLLALCRPYKDQVVFAKPASNPTLPREGLVRILVIQDANGTERR